MSTITDTDIILVNRGGTDYQTTAAELREYVKSMPWDGATVIFHVIVKDPADIKVDYRDITVYRLDTKAEVGRIDAPGEYIITAGSGNIGDLFAESPGNWEFGNLTDTSKATNMHNMFYQSFNFNSDISSWDVSNVTNMIQMLYDCKNFNQDLSGWCVPNVEKTHNFNLGCDSWTKPKPVWGTCP